MVEKSVSGKRNSFVIDIGNSYIKYAIHSNESGLSAVSSATSVGDLDSYIEQSDAVYLSSVGHDNQVEDVKALCHLKAKSLFIARTEAVAYGVTCAYESFHTMGVDRWLAILASREITDLPFAVIDLGTAITCDIVEGGQHLGGWIAPGFSLMRQTITQNTQQVFGNSEIPEHLQLGNSTEDCVNLGCLAALQGIVMSAENILSGNAKDYRIIVSGGNRKLISDLASDKIIFEENIVLKGLCLFIS